MKKKNVSTSYKKQNNKKLVIWLVDDLKSNRDTFKNAFKHDFTPRVFSKPSQVMKALLKRRRRLPDALLCDIFFYTKPGVREDIEEIVSKQAESIRKTAHFLDKVENKPRNSITGGIDLVRKIRQKLGNTSFPIFAYTSKGPYLLNTSEFKEIENLHMRWLFKKTDKTKKDQDYLKTLVETVERESREHKERYKIIESGFRDEYFEQFSSGGQHRFLLFQMDLANHSNWFKTKQSEKNLAKKELAKRFVDKLKGLKFHRLFWAGDGGVFVYKKDDDDTNDVVIEANDVVYEEFKKWKKKYRHLDTDKLDIRRSAHIAPVYTDEDPGFWTSEELNYFAKNERKMGKNGFAISEEIFKALSAHMEKRFKEGPRNIPGDDDVVIGKVYDDSKHKIIHKRNRTKK